MNAIAPKAAAILLVLAACQAEPESGATAVDPLLGQRLVAGNGSVFLFNADGTVGGNLGGDPIVGTYTADAREICSTYTAPARLAGQEFCSIPAIAGDRVVFNRRDGSQSQPYVIAG